MDCTFKPLENGRFKCSACGYEWRNASLHRNCPRSPRKRRSESPCVHLGNEVRRQLCETCGGRVSIKVFSCALHGEATVGKDLHGIACCGTCKDYSPSDSSTAMAHPVE